MDEIREIKMDAEKDIYRLRIYSDKLLGPTGRCPEDGGLAQATGDMYFNRTTSTWVVEYVCTGCNEILRSWTPPSDEITKQIAPASS